MKAFLSLLGKVLPLQVHDKTEHYRREEYVTLEQARDRLREMGIPLSEAKEVLMLDYDDEDDEPNSGTTH